MRPFAGRLLLVTISSLASMTGHIARSQSEDPLVAGFHHPPETAKPRVWWHWLDGNVSESGIQKDLTWLQQVGVGGVHNFDAALGGNGTTRLVNERVAYLTPKWRDMFRFAVNQAHERGMEFTIASSPGWSESGGPWVKPEQGMKKLVWSETLIQGGVRFTGTLPPPPHVTGPFQNVPMEAELGAAVGKSPEFYKDAVVVAYRAPVSASVQPVTQAMVTSSAGPIDASRLSDGDLASAVSLPYGLDQTAWIEFRYPRPQRIQSLTISVARPPGLGPSDMATGGTIWLEADDDGQSFRRVVTVPRDGAPQQTLSFPPTTAKRFRLVLARPAAGSNSLASLLGLPSVPAPKVHKIFELVLHPEARVNRFEDKDGFSNRAIAPPDDTPEIDSRAAIAATSVLDLTAKMHRDGSLDWTPPKGQWIVLRLGYSLTGRTNHPASREGTGLEVDKLNQADVKAYFDAYFGEYAKTLPPELIGKQGLQYMLTDSYEAGIANWTDDILSQFRKRRGYDALAYIPVLAGRIVDSSAASDRFLWDFRRTLSDLIAESYYGELSTLLHERGLGRYGESHESGRAFIGDGMEVKKSTDVPMGAMWSASLGSPRETYDADVRESASVAHIYGQKFVAAESLTAFGNTFAFTPETLKPFADRELAMGLNRFVIHTSVHQPDDRLGPGATLGPFGQWFTRHETWAGQAQPWISYLTRSAFMLQQGRFVADVAYLYGEDNNITNLFGRVAPPIPAGYNFDYVNSDALIHVFSVTDGQLATPSGMRYRVLVLDPSTQRMSLPVLRKIRDLVMQGATIAGSRPIMTPSLADDVTAFTAIADQLWGSTRNPGNVGQGRVVAAGALAQTLANLSIAPDCLFSGTRVGPDLRFVHHSLGDGELYFIASGKEQSQTVEASFRQSGKAPEIWHAITGAIEPASYRIERGRTVVHLELDPYDAVFVVFRHPTTSLSRLIPDPTVTEIAGVQGPWELRFPPDHGAPRGAHFDTLASWTANADAGIKYFAGTATYTTQFQFDPRRVTQLAHLRLDLGVVKNIAEVSINGRPLGVLWKAPFTVDITNAVRTGENQLEVKVTNVWPNRLIGDKQPAARRIAYATFDPYKADSRLLPSGLLGPVKLFSIAAH